MKKFLLTLVAVVSLVGCAEDSKKVADKMNSDSNQAQQLDKQGSEEYYTALFTSVDDTSVGDLDAQRVRLTTSYDHLSQARAKYKHILDLEDQHKDQVELIGKDSVTNRIAELDKLLSDLTNRINTVDKQKIELIKKARTNSDHEHR
jgi:hypothetical protein